jgi:YidC/Oxa1 family membrane protein insertase
MLGSIPVISPAFQILLNTIGWVLAEIYRFIPNYGASIVILTLLIRFILLPLGVKQIKSMGHMQAIQPKIKAIQTKYKGNREKIQEETMKLYKDAGVSPLGGCLPMLLQFPILIAMYAVIRMPLLEAVPAQSATPASYVVQNNHLPVDSRLFANVIEHTNTGLLIVNLQCSPAQSGTTAVLRDTSKHDVLPDKPLINGRTVDNGDPASGQVIPGLTSRSTLDCGNGIPSKIPYFVLLALMIATTFYQQRQMQKASPPNASSQQQQQIMKLMPIMFGVFGFAFPAGLVLYWCVSNFFQIGQQAYLLRAGHIGPEALERQMAENRRKNAANPGQPEKKSRMQRWMDQAQQAGSSKDGKPAPKAKGSGSGTKGEAGSGGSGSGKPASGSGRPPGPRRKPNTGGGKGPKKRPGGGSGGA